MSDAINVTPEQAHSVALRIIADEVRNNPAEWERWPEFSEEAWNAIDLACIDIADELTSRADVIDRFLDFDTRALLGEAS